MALDNVLPTTSTTDWPHTLGITPLHYRRMISANSFSLLSCYSCSRHDNIITTDLLISPPQKLLFHSPPFLSLHNIDHSNHVSDVFKHTRTLKRHQTTYDSSYGNKPTFGGQSFFIFTVLGNEYVSPLPLKSLH